MIMSSFICSAKHFNSIEENTFKMIRFDRDFDCYQLKQDFPKLYDQRSYDESEIFKEVKSIVNELRELNVICVSLQYKNHYDDIDKEIKEQKELIYAGKGYKHLNPAGLLKAFICVNYQIEIEHLEELSGLNDDQKKAMKFLNIMIEYLTYRIAISTPAYDSAEWEIN